MKVNFLHGLKENLPLIGQDESSLYFTKDTGEMFKSTGVDLPLMKISDVILVEELPIEGIEEKFYGLISSDSIQIYVWHDDSWKSIVSGEVDLSLIDILFNLKNKKDEFDYDEEGNIISITTTGEVNESISYEYNIDGNIEKEIILRMGKTITNTFSYDGEGNIIEINTVVV